MLALRSCRVTSPWEAFASTSLSSEMTCPDGDLVAVDDYFDSSGKVTRVTAHGAKTSHTFDSAH